MIFLFEKLSMLCFINEAIRIDLNFWQAHLSCDISHEPKEWYLPQMFYIK